MKIKDGGHICRRTGTIFGRAQLYHLGNISSKFKTSSPKGNDRSPESNGSVTYLKLMKPKGLGELCAATSDLANQTGIEKNRSFDHPQAELDILSFQKTYSSIRKPKVTRLNEISCSYPLTSKRSQGGKMIDDVIADNKL